MTAALWVLLLCLVLLLPSAALPRKGSPDPGARCLQGMAEDGGIGWAGPLLHPWPLGGLEGPVCRVQMDQDGLTPRHLEVVGVLTHYESTFIKVLRQRTSWDESYLETFGLCPAGEVGAALHPLKHIHAHVVEPGQDRFLVLHLEEGCSAARSRMTAAVRLFSKPDPGARCLQGMAEDGGIGWAGPRLHPWPLGGLEGPVCRVQMDQDGLTPRHLEVVGVLTHYESTFIKVLRQRTSWDESYLETFGLCPAGEVGAALHPLKHIHAHVVEPGQDRFLVLHLEEASLCLTRDTQYLVLGATAASVTRTSEHLSFEASLAIRAGGEGGAPLSPTETQQLLFGSDDKCFTRMTPVLLLLAKSRQEEEEEEEAALVPSSYLSADGVVDTAPYPQLSPPQARTKELLSPTAPSQTNASSPVPGGSSQFLGILTQFIRQVLSSSSKPPTQPSSHHWLDFQVMETLPHQLLHLSEEAALERLVQSEEPSVLLFPQDSGAVLEQHLGDWQPEGTVLQLLMGKLQAVIQELRDIPAFQANTGLFQHLLSFCYYPPGPAEGQAGERPPPSPPSCPLHGCAIPCCVPVRYSDQLIISLSTEGLEVRKFPNMVAEECGCR
ncbi:PREDICTED: muellerian-inhibiting factor [Charadrius vociferus]|uniref:muellerian-inhibiting factor n=1 Tax=Charadrius vociferus TaxID=50402 RepID=UPI0005217230|nr:PREDICTED: muellerian-inhibiting factor [Charadrius vociferus]